MTGRSCRLRCGRGLIPNSAVDVASVLTFITSARISLSLLEFLYRFASHLHNPLVTDDAPLPIRPVLLVNPGVSELLDCRKLFFLCSHSLSSFAILVPLTSGRGRS